MKLQAALFALSAGCVAAPSAGSDPALAVEHIEREFTFEAPVAATIYVHTRRVDHAAHAAEYDVEVGGRRLQVVYELRPGEELPLRTAVYAAAGPPLLVSEADDRQLRVGDAERWILQVGDYTEPGEAIPLEMSPAPLDVDAIAVLRAALPARPEVGAVPAFFTNRAGGEPVGPDGLVSSTSADRPLVDWSDDTSILGALTLAGVCLRGAGWDCPCFTWQDPLVGALEGACARGVVFPER
jgi:hypothetical protein